MAPPDIPASGATLGPAGPPLPGKKLDSWGEIALYLGREVRTVQRWEGTEGLPVHRHEHKKKSTVYAYTGELDAWIKKRQPKDDPEADAAFVPDPDIDTPPGKANGDPALADDTPADLIADEPTNRLTRLGRWLGVAAISSALLFLVTLGFYQKFHAGAVKPENVRLVVLPFVNLSGDPNQNYLSAGLTDVIT